MTSPKTKFILVITTVVLVALPALWLWHSSSKTVSSTQPSFQQSIATNVPAVKLEPTAFDEALTKAWKDQAAATDDAGKRQALALLKAAAATGSTNDISTAIRRFLDSKQDAPTGQGFKVGKNGFLTEAPTFRTFLLDYLAQIDPAAAAAYARIILQSKDSPDEWALALRNLALGDTGPDARKLLEAKTVEMLSYPPWQQNPSTGYLEAFDTAVYLGDSQLLPTLSHLLQLPDNSAVAHAAFLAMDRMVINNPAAMLTTLESDPALISGFTSTRADYFARADVRDPQQRQILENYLLNQQTPAAEISAFAGIYPNANYMVSANLLTPVQTPDASAIAARDAAALQTLQQWLADPRFAGLKASLTMAQVRLAGFVQQESQGH